MAGSGLFQGSCPGTTVGDVAACAHPASDAWRAAGPFRSIREPESFIPDPDPMSIAELAEIAMLAPALMSVPAPDVILAASCVLKFSEPQAVTNVSPVESR